LEQHTFIDSKFRLAILAAKRAKQLVNGAKKRVDTTADNPLNVALEELIKGHINYQVIEDLERENAQREALASLSDEPENSFLFSPRDKSSSLNFNDDDDEDEDELDDDDADDDNEDEDNEDEEDNDDDSESEPDDEEEDDYNDDAEDDDYDNDDFEVGDDDDDYDN
jgi:DNA-directed RNA polymerase omega subunit